MATAVLLCLLFCHWPTLLYGAAAPPEETAHPWPSVESARPPLLDWEPAAYSVEHRVGSPPASHFAIRVRNAGSGELQVAFFVSSSMSRFYLVRPRELTLAAGKERFVDIKAPLYLTDAESRFKENATLSIQTQGGMGAIVLSPDLFPISSALRIHQRGNGIHIWEQTRPLDSQVYRTRLVLFVASMALLFIVLCIGSAADARRLHGSHRQRRHSGERLPWVADGAELDSDTDESALEAVRAFQAAEARAAEKAAAQEEWDSAAAGASDGVADDDDGAAGTHQAPPAVVCSVCLLRPRDAAILPCRHVAACTTCVQRLSRGGAEQRRCPICRGPIDDWLELFLC